MNKLAWYFKQLFPLTYRSRYVENGVTHFAVWQMWFGKCYNRDDIVVEPVDELMAQLAAREQDFRTQNTLLETIAELKQRIEKLEREKDVQYEHIKAWINISNEWRIICGNQLQQIQQQYIPKIHELETAEE